MSCAGGNPSAPPRAAIGSEAKPPALAPPRRRQRIGCVVFHSCQPRSGKWISEHLSTEPNISERSSSKNRVHDTAFHAQRRAVRRGGKRAGDERNQRCYFVRCGKALQKRTRSHRAEKLAFHFSGRGVFRYREVGEE